VLDHLITAFDEDMIGQDLLDEGRQKVETAVKLNNGYARYLKRRASGEGSPVD